jgi:hypothetical protein
LKTARQKRKERQRVQLGEQSMMDNSGGAASGIHADVGDLELGGSRSRVKEGVRIKSKGRRGNAS